MTENNDKDEHPFAADRPVERASEDLLGRATFAAAIASAIKRWKQKDSLVVALYGAWGAGKSSVKNMVVEKLLESTDNHLLVVEFNPWQWSTSGDLTEQFFRTIGHRLGLADKSKEGQERARRWDRYAHRLNIFAKITDPLPGWALSVLVATGSVSTATASWAIFGSEKDLSSPWVYVPTIIAACVLIVPKWIGGILKSVAEKLRLDDEEAKRDTAELKRDLADSLRQREAPVVVVMDDVDRLSKSEIKLIFQLVKVNADFPNLVYFLLFQRDIIERALDHETADKGREYIEKIVQVSFDLPPMERPKLERVLFEGLDRILTQENIGERFDRHRWGNIFRGGLQHCFETIRDVRRFLSALSFHWALFRGDHVFEVNPVDLIALETLRVFEPRTYACISSMKSALTENRSERNYRNEAEEEKKKSLVKSALEDVEPQKHDAIREIIIQLFPSAEWAFGGPTYASESAGTWSREIRVCHPDKFDRYFQFAIPDGDVSESEIQLLISLAGKRQELEGLLRSLHERGLLGVMLNRLDSYKEEIDIAHAVPFVSALIDVVEELPHDHTIFSGENFRHRVGRIITWYLKQEKDETERANVLCAAIEQSSGLFLVTSLIANECRPESRKKHPDLNLVGEDRVEALMALGAKKIDEAARGGWLSVNPQLEFILYRWAEWECTSRAGSWLQGLIKSDDGVVTLLAAFTGKVSSHSGSDYVARERWVFHLDSLERFVPISTIENRMREIGISDLSDEHKRAVQAFGRALKRRRAGESDDDWPLDDDE